MLHPSYIVRSVAEGRLANEEPSEWTPEIQAEYFPNEPLTEFIEASIKACRCVSKRRWSYGHVVTKERVALCRHWRVKAQQSQSIRPFTGCRVLLVRHGGAHDSKAISRRKRYQRCVHVVPEAKEVCIH